MSNILTTPLVPGGQHVEWTIVRESADGSEEATTHLFQIGAQLYHPAYEVVPFVAAALEALAQQQVCEDVRPRLERTVVERMRLPTPCGRGILAADNDPVDNPTAPPRPDRLGAAERPPDPLADLLWTFWPQMQLPHDYQRTFARRRSQARVGIVWRLWYRTDGTAAASFRGFDFKGNVIPTFDVERRTLAELPEALLTTTRLAALFKAF